MLTPSIDDAVVLISSFNVLSSPTYFARFPLDFVLNLASYLLLINSCVASLFSSNSNTLVKSNISLWEIFKFDVRNDRYYPILKGRYYNNWEIYLENNISPVNLQQVKIIGFPSLLIAWIVSRTL